MSNRFYRFCFVMLKPIYGLFLPSRVIGLENVPETGGFVLCANHLSARDPIYLSHCIPTRQIHYMAKAEIFKYKLVAWFLKGLDAFPVDRGHNDIAAVRTALKLTSDGHALGIFPQGTRSRDNSRMPMHTGVSLIALRAKVPVIPCYIGGPYRIFRRTLVRFGAPVDLSDLGRRVDSETMKEATRRIEDAVWALKDADEDKAIE